MAMSLRARESVEPPAPGGNRRWKEQWGNWLMRSTIAAAAAHAVLFTLWPVWNVTREARDTPLEVLQIQPIIAPLGLLAEEEFDSPTTALPSEEELEIDRARGGGADEEVVIEEPDLAGLIEPDPTLAYPVLQSTSYGRPAPPLPAELNLDEVTILPRVARLPPSVAWPLIRNPVAVLRFLRTRYNPVYRYPDLTGSVSVAMWVNERGSVEWSEVRESSGHAVLDEIALSMFNNIVLFRPARSEGANVPVTVVIRVPFDAPW